MSFMRQECGTCGSKFTILLTSVNKVLCSDCKAYTDFRLKPKQASVLIHGLKGSECSGSTMKRESQHSS